MKENNPSKIIMGPGYHHYNARPFWEYFEGTEKQAREIFKIEHLRFFDRYLKGIDNEIDREPPILLHVMNGKGWRFEKERPLKNGQICLQQRARELIKRIIPILRFMVQIMAIASLALPATRQMRCR